MKKIYCDYAATTPVDAEVVKAMTPYYSENFGNPSSLHSFGQQAKRSVDHARGIIASFIGAKEEEIIFTSGGTESNNTSIKGVAYAKRNKGNHIITSSIEHHSIIAPCNFLKKEGFKITCLPVDKYGLVDPEEVKKAVTDKTILISIIHASNEIGTIQPIREIARIAKEREIYFHTDAVQTFGHINIDVNELGIDLMSASSHKLYGPKGIGVLYIKKGTKIVPFMHGGAQEKRKRASTENVQGIVGFGKAVEMAEQNMNEEANKLIYLRDKLIKGILDGIESTRLNGHPARRLPNNVNVSIEYIEGESMVFTLDKEGIACSTGSACSSPTLEPSHVLLAIGLSHVSAHGSLRFSLGKYTREEDIDYILEVLPVVVAKLRAMSPLYKNAGK